MLCYLSRFVVVSVWVISILIGVRLDAQIVIVMFRQDCIEVWSVEPPGAIVIVQSDHRGGQEMSVYRFVLSLNLGGLSIPSLRLS